MSSPDDEQDVDTNHAGHGAEDRHRLQKLLGCEDRVEVDSVRWNVNVTTEGGQMCAQTLRPGNRRQGPHLAPQDTTISHSAVKYYI